MPDRSVQRSPARSLASEFAAEHPPRNDPTLTVSGDDPRGAVRERERWSSPGACAVAGDEVGDLLAGHLAGDHPGRRSEQVAGRCVDDHRIRRTVKDAALAALSARPGRPATERNWELDQARGELAQLTEALKAQAIELALLRGKHGWT
jgi:hypothetical protein